MVSKNAKKKQQQQQHQNLTTTSSSSSTTKQNYNTSKTALSSSPSLSPSPSASSSSTIKAVKNRDADLMDIAQMQDISSTSEEFHVAKQYKAFKSSAMSETSVIETSETNADSLSSKFSSKSHMHQHQEMSDAEFSSMGNVISSIDLASESAIKEPVFSVPIDVVDICTSASTGSMKKVFSSSIKSSSQTSSSSTSQSVMQNIASKSSSTNKAITDGITDGRDGFIVDVEFKPETVIIQSESMATKKAFESLAKTTNGATEMTSSSTMSSQFLAAESVNGTTTRAEQQSNTNTEKQHYTYPAGTDNNNIPLPHDTYEVLMPPTPIPSTSSMTMSSQQQNNKLESSKYSNDDFTAFDNNNTSLTSIEKQQQQQQLENKTLSTSTATNIKTSSTQSNSTTNKSVNKKSSLTAKQITEQETLSQEQLTKKNSTQSKKEIYDVKTKTWSEHHDANDTKQPSYERFVSQGSDGTYKVTYKKKIYDRRNNKWRVVEEKTVNNANEKVFPEIVDDVINTTTTTYTTKIYDTKLGQWKVVDEKSFVDSKAFVPQDIAREIEKDNTDVANITTTTEITKVREQYKHKHKHKHNAFINIKRVNLRVTLQIFSFGFSFY